MSPPEDKSPAEAALADRTRRPRGAWAQAMAAEGPKEQTGSPAPSPHTGEGRKPGWTGPTYYGRAQLKPAPFNVWIVGGYIFVAGLSGAAALLSRLAEAVDRRRYGDMARRGRLIATIAPIVGAPLLIWDLHTPKRFYTMLRVAKGTSPMSIGTWILMAFTGASLPAAAAQILGERLPKLGWLTGVARGAHTPAAAAGAGLSVYTAALLSATSTPAWAAAPRALAVRFAASSTASGASALLLGERDPQVRATLETLAIGALAVEAAATGVQARAIERTGVGEALKGRWGTAEKIVATGLGVAAPLALFALSRALGRRRRRAVADVAAVATLAGGAFMRVAVLGVGAESASRPEISFRFSQAENLPRSRLSPLKDETFRRDSALLP